MSFSAFENSPKFVGAVLYFPGFSIIYYKKLAANDVKFLGDKVNN